MTVSLVYKVVRKLLSIPRVLLRSQATKDAELLVKKLLPDQGPCVFADWVGSPGDGRSWQAGPDAGAGTVSLIM
ncbi:hypothetical protein [Streptomyces sp. NBRC 110028]|uniref:hypothetical protein n=1 Tax=Streptomyces sp. NBRC 110028 TaxID=1621260 RepID=UPI000AC4F974|nr:hypothetical protein [Streptomyces sp. NBRC 110028]